MNLAQEPMDERWKPKVSQTEDLLLETGPMIDMRNKKIRVFCVLILLLVPLGCGPRFATSQDIYEATAVRHDPYDKYTWIRSPDFFCDGYLVSCHAFLRAAVKGGVPSFYQVYVSVGGKEFVLFNRALDINGGRLEFVEINRVDRSKYDSKNRLEKKFEEEFAITLDADYMERARLLGLDIQARGERGRVTIKMPAYVVDGFMSKAKIYAK